MTKLLKIRTAIGMSLLELLVTLTIIALLAGIGYPNYVKFKLETKREDAKITLVDMQSTIQRYLFMLNVSQLEAAHLATLDLPTTSRQGYYNIAVTIAAPNYSITATATGEQLKDLNCKTLTLDNLGVKTSTNSANAASTGCW
jgi:type IV pilus assembly protein PilE